MKNIFKTFFSNHTHTEAPAPSRNPHSLTSTVRNVCSALLLAAATFVGAGQAWAQTYTDYRVGHEGPTSAIGNSYVYLTIENRNDNKTVVTIRRDETTTDKLDWFQVTEHGNVSNPEGADELSLTFDTPTATDGTYTLEILWSVVGEDGNWMVQNLKVSADGSGDVPGSTTYGNRALFADIVSTDPVRDNPRLAIDGNDGTHWRAWGDGDASRTSSITLDLKQSVDLKSMRLYFEQCRPKSYHVEVSATGADGSWTNVHEYNGAGGAGNVDETFDLTANGVRYVRCTTTECATTWGIKFNEFQVFGIGEPELVLSSSEDIITVNQTSNLEVSFLDAYGNVNTPNAVSYTVSPAGYGTVENGVFHPAHAGKITITASYNGQSATTDVYVYDPDANLANNATVSYDNGGVGADLAPMFDGNDESVGRLLPDGAKDRTASFVLDLNKLCIINAVSVLNGQATSAVYTITGSADGTNWLPIAQFTAPDGQHDRRLDVYATEMEARYIRYESTRCGMDWGVTIREFRVFGEEAQNTSYSASTVIGDNTAANGADGNNDTRWESQYKDPQWWQVDYKNPKTFDQINILWNECYARDLQILATNDPVVAAQDPTGDGWTTLATFDDLDLPKADGRATQVINLDDIVKYRFIRVLGTERSPAGDNNLYGYSFYEFSIGLRPPYVKTLNFSAAQNSLSVGGTTTTTISAKDQNGDAFSTEGVTYTVDPVAVGSINAAGVFTANAEGTATITATLGTATATVDIEVYQPTPVVASFTANKTTIKVGETANLSYTVKDQKGNDWTATDVSYTISPASAGDITDGVFTAKAVGKATITINVDGATNSLDIQVNAPDATYSASSGNANEAVDNNLGTRWASDQNDNQWWQADYGTPQSFNAIEIVWEGAYGKSFDLLGSNDGTNWTPIKTVRNQELADFPNTKLYVTQETNNYRYVKFQGIERGTEWGYSFWEFRLKNVDAPVIAFKVHSDRIQVPVGQKAKLSVSMIDQYDQTYNIPFTDITYTSRNQAIGTVDENGVFTGKTQGSVIIDVNATEGTPTASAHRAPGDPLSGTIELTVVDSEPQAGADPATPYHGIHIEGNTDYADYNFVHTDGAHFWKPEYGNYDGTYYYTTTKETRRVIDYSMLEGGEPDMTSGILKDPRITNGERQRTHTLDHTVWANPGDEIYLYPFTDFSTQPRYAEQFIRWYDYATDKAAEGLAFDKAHYYSENFGVISGKNWGLGARPDGTVAPFATVAHYTAPDWVNDDERRYIACDISQTSVKAPYSEGSGVTMNEELWNIDNFNYTFSADDNGYGGITHTQSDRTHNFFIPNAPGGNEWASVVRIAPTELNLSQSKNYYFTCKLRSDKALNGVSLTLEQNGNGANSVFYSGPLTFAANTDYVYSFTGNGLSSDLAAGQYNLAVGVNGNNQDVMLRVSDIVMYEIEADHTIGNVLVNCPNQWPGEKSPTFSVSGNTMNFHFPTAAGGQWSNGANVDTQNLALEQNKNYTFTCKVRSDKALNGVTLKLMRKGNDTSFFFSKQVSFDANTDYEFVYQGLNTVPDLTAGNVTLTVGVDGNGEDVNLQVSDISIIEGNAWDFNNSYGGWGNGATITSAGNSHTFNFPTAGDGNQWSNGGKLRTQNMALENGKRYAFSCKLRANAPFQNTTIKLQQADNDNNYLFQQQLSFAENTDYNFTYVGTVNGFTAAAGNVDFTLGLQGSGNDVAITVSDIQFAEISGSSWDIADYKVTGNMSQYTQSGGSHVFHYDNVVGDNMWANQGNLEPLHLSTQASKKYIFTSTVLVDEDVNSISVKVENKDNGNAVLERYYIPVTKGVPTTITLAGEGKDASNLKILYLPLADNKPLNLTVSNVHLYEYIGDEQWASVDDLDYYVEGAATGLKHTHTGHTHTFTVDNPQSDWWNGANMCFITPDELKLSAGAVYNFTCKVAVSDPTAITQLHLKLQKKETEGATKLFENHYSDFSAEGQTYTIIDNQLSADVIDKLEFLVSGTGGLGKPVTFTVSDISLQAVGVRRNGFVDEDNKRIYEPILHNRQLFTIRPAAYIADQLSKHNVDYIKSNRRKVSGRAGVRFNVRLDYEMPANVGGKSPLYYLDESDNVQRIYSYEIRTFKKVNDVETLIPNIFTGDGGQYYDAKFSAVMTGLDGTQYYRGIKCAAGNAEAGTYVVKIYGCDQNGQVLKTHNYTSASGATFAAHDLEIMEYEVTFLTENDASFLTEKKEAESAVTNPSIQKHTEEYLKSRLGGNDFIEAAAVTFDDYPKDEFRQHMFPDLYAGTYYKWPLVWKGCTYMFGYDIQRRDPGRGFEGNDFNMYMILPHTSVFDCTTAARAYTDPRQEGGPMGDYGLYDRKFYRTGEMGNFFAVNASSDPGRMVDAQINDLCLGSTLHVSAWVAELSNKNQWGGSGGNTGNPNLKPDGWEPCSETANLIFTFNAVDNRGSKIPLHSFVTGYVDRGNGYSSYMDKLHGDGYGTICDYDWNNGIKKGDGDQGQWMHVYYSFVPDVSNLSMEQLNNIAYYELSLENNCVSSDGADYAIDDIRIYISKPQVFAEQLAPICTGEKDTEIKISANFESMLSTLGVEEGTADDNQDVYFYYTFLDYDKYYDGADHTHDTPEQQQARFENAVLKYQYLTVNPDGSDNASENQGYGIAKFNTYFPNNVDYKTATDPHSGTVESWRDTDKYATRYVVFNTHPLDHTLFPGKEYIISIFGPATGDLMTDDPEHPILTYYNFPVDDLCAKRCVFRVHSSGVVKINGKVVTDEDEILVCDNQYPTVNIDAFGYDKTLSQIMTEPLAKNAPFDWYGGSMKEFLAEKRNIDGEDITLHDALNKFRAEYPVIHYGIDDPNYSNAALPAKNDYTEGIRQYLIEMTTPTTEHPVPKLALYKTSFTMTPGELTDASGRQACYLVAIPVEAEKYIVGDVEKGKDDIMICLDPSEIRVYISAHSPHMVHGFPKYITYPESMDDVPLRIGLDQLDLRTRATLAALKGVTGAYEDGNATAAATAEANIMGGLVLNIPIRKVTPTQDDLTTLRRFGVGDAAFLPEDVLIYLTETNDPEYKDLPLDADDKAIVPYRYDDSSNPVDDEFYLPQVGVLLGLQAVRNGTQNMMRMAFRDDFRFKEGYYYRFLIKYTEDYPAGYVGEKTECDGQLVFTLKVVPKYQEWVGGTSLDFNNDRNWRRIESAELNHELTADDDKANKLTDGYATSDDAKDLGYANTRSYVPMDFTDVLIPSTVMYPRMYNVDDNSFRVPVLEGGNDFDGKNGSSEGYLWPRGSNETTGAAGLNSGATSLIEYDMAAWSSSKGVNCRPWYANRVEHITFLPGAEMYAQQYLNYQRAWVELELAPDRWYTLTSPLKKTVSGDMYLPSDQTTTPGRQMTEHFLPITYDNSRNDRFRPAVYQRAWDHSGIAKIYRMDGDGLYNKTTAQDGSKHSIDDAYVQATWSHVYNDNEEIFTDGRGFSIKTDVSRIPIGDQPAKVLFRLPKDDTYYEYHNSVKPQGNDAVGTTTGGHKQGGGATINRTIGDDAVYAQGIPNQARLNDVNGTITVTTQNAGQYFLVGNPFMAALDMQKFFTENESLINNKYWIVTADHQEVTVMDGATSVSTGLALTSPSLTVAPMQAFFVEAKDASVTRLNLSYNEDMQVNYPIYRYDVDGNEGNVANPNLRPEDFDPRPGLQMPARRSGVALDGQLRILLSDPSEQESRSDNAPRLVSTAVVALAPMASADYNAAEDAILLLDSNLDSQSALYTVAGETAVSINRLERIETIPLGIICNDDEAAKKMLTLSFDGADAFPQPLYLYDTLSGETTAITDDLTLNVPANTVGQYFITTGLDKIDDETAPAGPMYNLKGIRVANTRNEHVIIQGTRKSVVK